MKKNTLPIFGVGPTYVICCMFFTVLGLVLNKTGLLNSGNLPSLKIVSIIIGEILIFIGGLLWVHAVIIQKISSKISSGHLVTSGVYSIVRNPIYSAFLFVFTGILITAHNTYLFILPPIFYLFLTMLMKHTEEKWLFEKFGDSYTEYCTRVNRVIPWFRH